MGYDHNTPPPSTADDMEDVLVDDEGLVLEEVLTLDEDSGEIDDDDDDCGEDAGGGGDAGGGAASPEPDMARLTLDAHTGSAFCCALSPAGGALLATGGEDDCARLWSTDTGALLMTTSGHLDSVTQVAFSHDGRLLATGDMAGRLHVYQLPSQQLVWQFEVGADLTWLGWHSAAAVLLAGTQAGDGWLWRVPRGDARTLAGHGRAVTTAALLPDGARLLVGYDDGSARLFNLRSGAAERQLAGGAAAVTCVAAHRDNVLLTTASADGWLRVHSATATGAAASRPLAMLPCCPEAGAPPAADADADDDDDAADGPCSVEAAAFSPCEPGLLATATVGGVLTVWDVPAQRARHQLAAAGLACLRWAPAAARLWAGCLDGAVLDVDARSGAVRRLTSAPASVLDLAVADDGRALAAAGDDGKVRLFAVADAVDT